MFVVLRTCYSYHSNSYNTVLNGIFTTREKAEIEIESLLQHQIHNYLQECKSRVKEVPDDSLQREIDIIESGKYDLDQEREWFEILHVEVDKMRYYRPLKANEENDMVINEPFEFANCISEYNLDFLAKSSK